MAYIERELADGESLVMLSRPSWWTVIPRTVLAAAVLAAVSVALTMAGVLTTFMLWVFVVPLVLLAWIAMITPPLFRVLSTEIAITDRRVTSKTGIINIEVKTTPLDKVNNVNVVQSVFGRMLGYGDLEVTTATAEEADNHFVKTLAHPNEFRNELTALADQ